MAQILSPLFDFNFLPVENCQPLHMASWRGPRKQINPAQSVVQELTQPLVWSGGPHVGPMISPPSKPTVACVSYLNLHTTPSSHTTAVFALRGQHEKPLLACTKMWVFECF